MHKNYTEMDLILVQWWNINRKKIWYPFVILNTIFIAVRKIWECVAQKLRVYASKQILTICFEALIPIRVVSEYGKEKLNIRSIQTRIKMILFHLTIVGSASDVVSSWSASKKNLKKILNFKNEDSKQIPLNSQGTIVTGFQHIF